MRKLTTETKVGIFFVVVFLLIAWISTRLGDYAIGEKYPLQYSARFPTAAGIQKDTKVYLAGIKIGVVEDTRLDGGKALVEMKITAEAKIPDDSRISIASHGFLGQKYIEILPGASTRLLESGKEFENVDDSGDLAALTGNLNDVAEDIKAVTTNLREVFGGEEGQEGIRDVFISLNTITTTLADTLEANQDRMDAIMANVESFSGNLSYVTTKNREEMSRTVAALPAIAENLKEISGHLATVMSTNREDISATLENLVAVTENLSRSLEAFANVAQKIDDGQGTLGKLVNDDETITSLNEAVSGINDYVQRLTRLEMEFKYRGEYHIEQQEAKSFFALNIRPNFDKVYMLALVDSPKGRTRTTEIETTTVENPGAADEETSVKNETRRVTSDELLFSAQFGKRWHDFLFRGGIIESKGGVGVEYFLFDDHLDIAFEASDFSKDNNPRLKTYLDLMFLDHFFVTAGVDDFINKYDDPRWFLGAGLYFNDRDLSILAARLPTGGAGL